MFMDPSGETPESIWDVISLILSIKDVSYNPKDVLAWVGLVGDVIDLIPCVTGVGETVRGIKTVSKTLDVVDNISDSRRIINSVNGLATNVGYDSFDVMKKAIGSAGEGKHWHHIVEQSQIEKAGFSPQQIHNTSNIIAVDASTHAKITGHYKTTKYEFTNGKSVRDWLAGQSYEIQYEYGVQVLKDYGVIK